MTLIGILLLVASFIPAWIIQPPRRPMSTLMVWLHFAGFLVLFFGAVVVLRVE